MSDIVGYRVGNSYYGSFVCSECADIPGGDALTQGEATEENAICCMCFKRLDGQEHYNPHEMDICGWWYLDDYGWGEPPNIADRIIDDLEECDPTKAAEFRKRLETDRIEHPTEGEAWLVDEVVEALNEFCPAGCYVGVNDRGMMGCWPI